MCVPCAGAEKPDDKMVNRMKDWMGQDHSSFNNAAWSRDLGLGTDSLAHVSDQHYARSSRPAEDKGMIAAADEAEADAKTKSKKGQKAAKTFDKIAAVASLLPELVQMGCKLQKKSSEMIDKAEQAVQMIEQFPS